MRNKRLILIGLLLLGVGFAIVSTTLLMTGNIKIATNNLDFDIKFTKAFLDETDISVDAISPDGKVITFSTKDLSTVGNISKLDFEVTNNSEMYDAVVSIDCSATGAKNNYYEITKEVESPIAGKKTGKGKVEVKLLKATEEDFSETFTCTLTATANERTSKAKEKYVPKYFEFGEPSVASTQVYTTLGKNVFAGLDEDGIRKSVCIVRDGSLECFKTNNWDEEKKHILEVFRDIECDTSNSSQVTCNADDFGCYVDSYGNACCHANNPYAYCDVYSGGSVSCY